MVQRLETVSMKRLKYLARRAGEKAWDALDDGYRGLWQNQGSQSIVNKKEIRVIGLRRSGNHAIINWITKQEPIEPIFINHTRVLENPYRDVYRDQLIKQKNPDLKGWRCEDINWWKQQSKGDFSFKDCLIYSYEDQELERITHASFEKKHDFYLGRSEERYDLILIRDPFNLFASRLKRREIVQTIEKKFDPLKVYSRQYTLPELWVCYAKECLGETNFLKNNKIVVNYNQWFTDVTYRQQLAERLKVTFSDAGFGDVRVAGGGSSFDGTKFSGEANKMDVLNRWKVYMDDPLYRQLFENEELLAYSTKIFGLIPGAEAIA